MLAVRIAAIAAALLAGVPAAAGAQRVWAGGAWFVDAQRFDKDDVPNRLDGHAPGWAVLARGRLVGRLALGGEWSEDTIDDVRETTLDIGGRAVTVRSTFAHRTRALGLLAGYTHGAGRRSRLGYLAGVGLVSVERHFTTDAPGQVLTGRSDRAAPRSAAVTDRFASFTAGVDVLTRLDGHLFALGGARIARLTLQPGEQNGWSVRLCAGAAWAF